MPYHTGRAIVCFERYPTAPHNDPHRKPLLAVRFLEALTPIKRLAPDGRMLEPVPGEFLTVDDGREGHVPWGFIKNNAATRQMVSDWIEEQGSQLAPSLDS